MIASDRFVSNGGRVNGRQPLYSRIRVKYDGSLCTTLLRLRLGTHWKLSSK